MRIVYLLASLGVGGAEKQALAVAERMADARPHSRIAGADAAPAGRVAHRNSAFHLDMRKTPWSAVEGFKRGARFSARVSARFGPQPRLSRQHLCPPAPRGVLHLPAVFVVLSTVHNVYEGGWRRMLAYRLTDFLSRRTVAVSEAAADRFIRSKPCLRRKCSVILNGIDVDGFAPDADASERAACEGNGNHRSNESPTSSGLPSAVLLPAKDYPNFLRAFAAVERGSGPTRACGSPETRAGTSIRRSKRLRKN